MLSDLQAVPGLKPARPLVWAGRVITALVVVFLAFDALIKLFRLGPAMEATVGLGYSADAVFGLGALLLITLILYLVPRLSLLGAVLLTGYLGGAIATHLRAGSEAFSLVFPAIMGAMLWGGLYLRDARLRQLVFEGPRA